MGIQAIRLLHPAQPVDQRRMGVARAFRAAGRTRGVNHIGQLLRVMAEVQVAVVIAMQRLGGVIEGDDPDVGRGQTGHKRLLGEQQVDAAVLDHVGQALLRVFRVQRHVGAARLEDRQQADHHLQRTFERDAHQHIRAHALFAQVPCQLIGAGIELRITERLLPEHQCAGLRGARHLRLEQMMHAAIGRVRRGRVVPFVNLRVQFAGIEHRQLADPALGIGHQRPQQVAPVARHAGDGRGVEQIVGIGQRCVEAPAFFPGVQAQVELSGARFPFDQAQFQARSRLDRFKVRHLRLVVVHHLEQRVMAQVAFQLERLDQLLEWQLLMGLGAEGGFLDRTQQVRHRGLGSQFAAQHLGVHEKADQPFDLTPVAVGDRHADTHIGLAAVAVQQNVERRQQQHEQRDRVALRQCAQLLHQCRIEREFMAGAAIAWHRRARVIGGQRDDRVFVAQPVAPIRQLPRLLASLQPAALPQRIVAVLNRQFGQLWRLTALKGVITAHEFVDQHIHRPAVRHDVVQGQQQDVFIVSQFQQQDAQQGAIGQIEGQQRLALRLGSHRLIARYGRQQGEIHRLDRQRLAQGHLLEAVIGVLAKHRAQGFVALHHMGERLLQRRDVQLTLEAHRARQVVRAAVRVQLPQKPHAPLCVGQCVAVVLRHLFRNRELRKVDPFPAQPVEE